MSKENGFTVSKVWLDAVVGNIDEEADAYSLYQALADKFGWSGSVFSPLDCYVETADGEILAGSEYGLTEGQRAALSNTYAFRDGLPERLTERGYSMLPRLIVAEDGSWTVEEA